MPRCRAVGKKPHPVSECHVGISVGASYCEGEKLPAHEGENLRALFAWVEDEEHYERVHVTVADTLQRHSRVFLLGESEGGARVSSHVEGRKWFERNADVFRALCIPQVFHWWDDWLRDPRYLRTHTALQELYKESAELRHAVNQDVMRFLRRPSRRGMELTNLARAKEASRKYILEEAAAWPLIVEDCSEADVYPGKELSTSKLLRKLRLPPVLEPLGRRRHIQILCAGEGEEAA